MSWNGASYRDLGNRVTGTYTAPKFPSNIAGNYYDRNGFNRGAIQNNFGFGFQQTNSGNVVWGTKTQSQVNNPNSTGWIATHMTAVNESPQDPLWVGEPQTTNTSYLQNQLDNLKPCANSRLAGRRQGRESCAVLCQPERRHADTAGYNPCARMCGNLVVKGTCRSTKRRRANLFNNRDTGHTSSSFILCATYEVAQTASRDLMQAR